MTDIREDIANLLEDEEIGVRLSVYDHVTKKTTIEYGYYRQPLRDVTRGSYYLPHDMLDCLVKADTTISPGNLLTFESFEEDNNFIVVTVVSDSVGRDVVQRRASIYKCNAVVDIQRREKTRDPDTLSLAVTWPTHHSGEYVYISGRLRMHEMMEEDFGQALVDKQIVYISSYVDVKEEDRCVVRQNTRDVSGEAFEIAKIEPYKLPGVKVCQIVTDERE